MDHISLSVISPPPPHHLCTMGISSPATPAMDCRLHEVILKGDVPAFLRLVEQDEDLLKQTTSGTSNTALHLAARLGHAELAVAILELWPEMVTAGNAEMETPLHEACREGRMEIVSLLLQIDPLRNTVEEILKARERNCQGRSPLHLACSTGHLQITRELLRLDSDLASLQDLEGLTPLHCAAAKGRVSVIHEILSTNLESAKIRTRYGETVLHLAVKNNQFEVLRHLIEKLNVSPLINLPDNDGNTVLHLAVAGKLSDMVIYLLKLRIDVNALNRKRHTALDIAESDPSNSGALGIVPTLQKAGAKRGDHLPSISPEIQCIAEPLARRMFRKNIQKSQHHGRRHRRATQLEHQTEGIRNARNTIIVVSVLIATVAFAAGINPPGGFHQDTGKAILARQTPFKAFMTLNVGALFTSLGNVSILVSVIPFGRKAMMKLLTLTHKIMCLSILFMSSACIAAVWAIIPHDKGMGWVSIELVCLGGGYILIVFSVLGVMLAKHWHRKWKWRESKENSTICRVGECTSNSDIDSSNREGYHLY